MDFSTQTLFVKLDYENTFIVFTWALSLQEVVELAVSNRVLGLRSLSNSSLMQMYICQLTFDPVPSSHQVISALLQTMEDQTNPRVQAHAAAALINFTEDCPKSLLIPYLDSLVQHLHVIMVAKLQEVCLSMCAVFLSYSICIKNISTYKVFLCDSPLWFSSKTFLGD